MSTSIELEKLISESKTISNPNKTLSEFFNGSCKAKLLDVFLDNPDLKINIMDIMDKANLSRKFMVVDMPILIRNGIVVEEQYKWYKFFKLNTKNPQVKQISKFRDSIDIVNTSTIPKRKYRVNNNNNSSKVSKKKDNR